MFDELKSLDRNSISNFFKKLHRILSFIILYLLTLFKMKTIIQKGR